MTTANVTKLEDNRVRLEVEVSPEAVKRGVEAKVRELRKQVRVPGFRPGKAPRRIIENHVGRDYIYVEALQDSLPTWYSEAVVDQDLRPIDTPKIDFDGTLDEEQGFSFSAEVEVRPEATLGRYKGLEVPRREVEVTDEQVDERMNELREQFATLAAVEDRPVAEGDYVILDYRGEGLSGNPVEGAEAEDQMIEVGSGEILEDFDKELVGIEAGGRKRFAVTFPMDYDKTESLRGQAVLFNVHVKEIKERDLPPLDDDFAMEASEFDTLDELRAAVRGQLEAAIEQRVEGEFRGRVLEAVADEAEVTVPDVMVDDKADEMVQSFERSVQAQGIEPEQYYMLAGASRDDVKGRVREDAADTVKKELVLDAVARAENIEADQHELEHQIEHLAEDTGRKPKEVEKTMRRNGTYRLLEEELSRQKALDFLVENATPVPMPPEEEAEEGGAEVAEPPGAEEGVPEAGEAKVGTTVEAGAGTAGETPETEKKEGEE